jgi:hypothetical protein
VTRDAMTSLIGPRSTVVAADGNSADSVALFNPLNWDRQDVITLSGTIGRGLAGTPCERLPGDDAVRCLVSLPAVGLRTIPLGDAPGQAEPLDPSEPARIPGYVVTIDPHNGLLTSIRSEASGRELLGAPSDRIVLERQPAALDTQDDLLPRSKREIISTTADAPATVLAWRSMIGTTFAVTQTIGNSVTVRRTIRAYADLPRIDVETTLGDVPNGYLVSSDFALAGSALGEERGIPFGTSALLRSDFVHPAIGWSAVSLAEGGGLALLDRGVPGRELSGNMMILPLLNAYDAYRGKPNPWLSGRGEHRFDYSIVPLETGWREASVPLRAHERNAPPIVQLLSTGGDLSSTQRSWLRTSDNVIVESVRRVGTELEIRLVEWTGTSGTGTVELGFSTGAAYLTDALGANRQLLGAGGPLHFDLRPQQIVTIRVETPTAVPDVPPLTTFRDLVPPAKAASLEKRHSLSGQPPE